MVYAVEPPVADPPASRQPLCKGHQLWHWLKLLYCRNLPRVDASWFRTVDKLYASNCRSPLKTASYTRQTAATPIVHAYHMRIYSNREMKPHPSFMHNNIIILYSKLFAGCSRHLVFVAPTNPFASNEATNPWSFQAFSICNLATRYVQTFHALKCCSALIIYFGVPYRHA